MHYEWEHAVAAGSHESGRTLDVPMTTGDELCREEGFEPDVVKIDVEGHEVKVLRGLKETMRRCRPSVFLEIHPERILQEGEQLSFLTEFFAELRYGARMVSGESLALADITRFTRDERLYLSAVESS